MQRLAAKCGDLSDASLNDLGLLDPDQPTKQSTNAHREAMRADFTPAERYAIRVLLAPTPTEETDHG